MDKNCKDCIESKVPKNLQEILKDEKKREKLVIFINPPYAEATSGTTPVGTGTNKPKVATDNATYEKYKEILGKASNELFAQFFIRIYQEIPHCKLAAFSKLKYINSSNFVKFRETFLAKFLRGFAAPAFTFDNVSGQFPIGFLVWDLSQKVKFKKIKLDMFDSNNIFVAQKSFSTILDKHKNINQWIKKYNDKHSQELALMVSTAPDFQHNQQLALLSKQQARYCFEITKENLIVFAIYFAVRHCILHTWINHNDQFLYPNNKWQKDIEFHNNCLAFTLFYEKNRITSKEGVNHFIPFSESEVGAKEAFASNFMHRFMSGKIKADSAHLDCAFKTSGTRKGNLDSTSESFLIASSISKGESHNAKSPNKKIEQRGFAQKDFYIEQTSFIPTKPLVFNNEAKAVFKAGRELWVYYHAQEFKDSKNPYNPNASLYDIKAHFQGFNDKGKMNPPQKAQDSHYKDLLGNLNYELQNLAKKIEPKIYEYGFLLE